MEVTTQTVMYYDAQQKQFITISIEQEETEQQEEGSTTASNKYAHHVQLGALV